MMEPRDAPEGGENRFRWRSAEGGPTTAGWVLIGVVMAVVVLGFGAWWTFVLERGGGMDGTGMQGRPASPPMGEMEDAPRFPRVRGFHAGEEVVFIHSEASDEQVADMLTGMMGSPVVVVPSLADAPESALATVYVFTNGVRPDGPRGPFGFQPDVFDSAPGDEGYSPLREVVLVTWRDEGAAQVLRSADEVETAIADRRVSEQRPGVVVNMPFLRWPDGQR